MTSPSAAAGADTSAKDAPIEGFAAFVGAVADDLEILATLHDREPSGAMLAALQSAPIEDQLGLTLSSEAGREALVCFARALKTLRERTDQPTLDDLAAQYADVYLRHTYRAGPTESVWLTEDGLERQAPMFHCRDWYRRHNLKVTDWANRPDDHIVLQLRFVARLVAEAHAPADLAEPTRFLDEHLLRWIDKLAIRLIEVGAPDLYAALALLTARYLDELRGHLTELTGIERPTVEAIAAGAETCSTREPSSAYIPGVAPSW